MFVYGPCMPVLSLILNPSERQFADRSQKVNPGPFELKEINSSLPKGTEFYHGSTNKGSQLIMPTGQRRFSIGKIINPFLNAFVSTKKEKSRIFYSAQRKIKEYSNERLI
jgi:hypothetical protein